MEPLKPIQSPKRVFLGWLCLFLPVVVIAQRDIVLSGMAVEQNSRYTSGKVQVLSNVSVDAPGAIPTITDGRGIFVLEFTDLPAGSSANIRARKAGFVVVNGKELRNAAVLGRLLPLRIVMSRPEVLTQNQLAYYGIAQDFIREQRAELLAIIRREDEASRQLITELEERLGRSFRTKEEAVEALSESFDKLAEQLQSIADRFATINLDEQDSLYALAFDAFRAETPTAALQTLDTVNLETRLLAIEADIQRLRQRKRKELNTLLLRAELHFMALDWEQAGTDLRLALQFDSTDAEVLFDYGNLLAARGLTGEAATYYERALLTADSTRLYPLIRNNLANQYYQLGRYDRCESLYREAIGWHLSPPLDTSARAAVLRSSAMQNLANFYVNRRQLTAADSFYRKALVIRRSLATSDPQRYGFLLANTLHNLGDLHWQWKKMDEAGAYFAEAVALRRAPAPTAAFAPVFDLREAGLAQALNGLGLVRMEENDFPAADSLLREALSLRKALAAESPRRYDAQLAESYTNLGVLAQRRDDLATADSLYRQARQVYERLLSDENSSYRRQWCRLLLNLSGLQRAQGNFSLAATTIDQALMWLEPATRIDTTFRLTRLLFLREQGAILAGAGNPSKARDVLNSTLDAVRQLPAGQRSEALETGLLQDLATLSKNQKDWQAAADYYQQIITKAIKKGNVRDSFFAQLDLAGLVLAELRDSFSRKRYRQGLKILEAASENLPAMDGNDQGEGRDLLRYYFREYEAAKKNH